VRENFSLFGYEVLNMEKISSRDQASFWKWAKRSMFLSSLTLALLLCLFSPQAEVIQPKSPESLRVWVDYACFRNLPDTSQTYVEIYYSFNRKQLKFAQEGETYQAKLFLNLTIEDKLGNLVEKRMWNRWSKVNRWEETQIDYNIFDEIEVILEAGEYLLKLSVTDLGSESQGEASLEMKVRALGEKNLQLSDLELAFQIEPDTSTGLFTKAGRKILPNPLGVFTRSMGMVYFYAELYNLTASPTANPDYLLSFTVLDSTGKKVRDFGSQTQKKPGVSAVVLSGINISTLLGGGYALRVEALDQETGQKAFVTKNFTILSEEVERKCSTSSPRKAKKDSLRSFGKKEIPLWILRRMNSKSSIIVG
jgi:hypothetical protein